MNSKQQIITRMNRIAEEVDEYGSLENRKISSARKRAPIVTRKVVSFTTSDVPGAFASSIHNDGSHDDDDTDEDKENSDKVTIDTNLPPCGPGRLKTVPGGSTPKRAEYRPTISRSNGEHELVTSHRFYEGPTPLHQLCYDAKSSDDLGLSNLDYGAASIPDSEGKLPLHIFAENIILAISECEDQDPVVIKATSSLSCSSSRGQFDKQNSRCNIQPFLLRLLHAHPLALITLDQKGFFPFENILHQWILNAYDDTRMMTNLGSSRSIFTRTWVNTSLSVSSALVHVGKSFAWNGQSDPPTASVVDVESKAPSYPLEEEFPKHIRMTSIALFAIQMLSHVVEYLQDSKSSLSNRCELLQEIVTRFSVIPNLMKTVFLVECDDERLIILSSTFVRCVASHQGTIGPWLTSILTAERSVSMHGLQYLSFVSDLPLTEDFYETISNLEGFIPSLLGMDELSIEQAATTTLVKHVLDRVISRPFCVGVVFFDGLFLCILIVGFRAAVDAMLVGKSPGLVLRWVYVANTGIFYFLIRELGKAITILERTKQATIYLWSFWNVTDILSTMLTLISVVVIRVINSEFLDLSNIQSTRVLLAIATGLLWLRVLSLLKTLNIHLATFVLAIIQITRDILWFCVILAVVVASFSQMFYTLLLPPSCATAESSNEESCYKGEYYLRTFTILLGDFGGYFSRSSFTTAFSVFLIVFFSFMVVVVLLNVLIAIVSDSYEKCLIRSHHLFGRARVMLIAELVSFQNLLRIEKDGRSLYSQWWSGEVWNRWSRGSVCFFVSSVLVVVVWVVGETAGYFAGERNGNYIFSLLSVVVIVALFWGIVVFLSTAGDEKKSTTWYNKFIQKSMLRLLGSSREQLSNGHNREGRDEWRGRADYFSRELLRISGETNTAMGFQVDALSSNFASSSKELRNEISNVESQIVGLKEEVMMVLSQMEIRNAHLIREMMMELTRGQSVVDPMQTRLSSSSSSSTNRSQFRR